MARRKKSSRKSSKCPEPINTMIDLAAGLTMGVVASHMEKKYHYSKKGKINPYTVSAIGLATGKMKSTKDILRTGAVLGAMGSFDVEADDEHIHRTYVPEDPVFREISKTKVNDNRYAWRLNCIDGTEYGIFPENYETRDEYNEAINEAQNDIAEDCTETSSICTSDFENPTPMINVNLRKIRVSRLDNGSNQFYLTYNLQTKVGDRVTVSTESGTAEGIVIGVEKNNANHEDLPYVIE